MRRKGWMVFAAVLWMSACSGGGDAPTDVSQDTGSEVTVDVSPDGSADLALPDGPLTPDVADDLAEDLAQDAGSDICVPQCTGKDCGDNGCGGTCGECPEGEICDGQGQCAFHCSGSDDCPEEAFCKDGECVDDICTPGTAACDDNTIVVCNEEGSAFEGQADCSEGLYCEDGACHEQTCTPGFTECDGDLLMVCDALGKQMELKTDCGKNEQYCFDGKCMGTACQPGQSFCEDGLTLAVCDETGMEYVTESCPEGAFCLTGECIPWACQPGEPVCKGFFATLCDESGNGPVPGGEDCAQQGKFCIDGECTKCFPDCFGKECGDDGCGGACGNCDDGNPCTQEQCQEDVFMCTTSVVADCCLADEECADDDSCTLESCVANKCESSFVCCESHNQCDDGDDNCTHDLCLNSHCWHKPIPEASCCPGFAVYEGFEFQTLPGWNLAAGGNKSWAVSDVEPFEGGYSLHCPKAQKGAVVALPGPIFVPANGAALQFYYRTVSWNVVDCQSMGLRVSINQLPADLVCQAAPEWTLYSLDLSAWAGQEVQVTIQYLMEDKDNPEHAVFIDELKLTMPCCIHDLECDDGQLCTKDTCNSDGICTHETDPGCCQPAMLQEEFESGTAWNWSLGADDKDVWSVLPGNAHSGTYALEAHFDDSGAIATLPGTYTIPANGGALKFWYRSYQWNLVEWGVHGVTVLVNGAKAAVVGVPVDKWTLHVQDLSPWAGQTVTIQLKYQMGLQGNENNKVVLDDVQVVRDCCDSTDECDDGNNCTTDSCGLWGACIHDADPACCHPEVYEENFDSGVAFQWKLSGDNLKFWAINEDVVLSGASSLNGNVWHNGAVATLPGQFEIPPEGLTLAFAYKTVDWKVLDCAVDGIAVLVNGHVEGRVCQASPDTWETFVIGLSAWAGQTVTIQLKYNIISAGNGNHQAYIDDVQIVRDCCQSDADCDDGKGCTQDSCSGICENIPEEGCCGDALLVEGFEQSAWNWSLGASAASTWVLADGGLESLKAMTASQWSGNPSAHLPGTYLIPASGATLSFQYKTANWNVLDCTYMGIQVWVNGQRFAVACEAKPDEWGEFSLDMSKWGGQTVKIALRYLVKADGNYANQAWVDDVRLDPICCDEASECDDQKVCTVDSCAQGGACVHTPDDGCCDPVVYGEDFDSGTAWGWSLAYGTTLAWEMSDQGSADGTFSLSASWAVNTAVARLPALETLPYDGGYVLFWYRTEGWNVLDCNWMGVTVSVNGEKADVLCTPALEWTMYTVDLYQWAGSAPEITLTYHVANANNPAHRIFIDDLQIIYECP